MAQNDPKMIHTLSTYQTPPCLNCCLSSSKHYRKPTREKNI